MNTWSWIAACLASFGLGGFAATWLNLRMIRSIRRDRIRGYIR